MKFDIAFYMLQDTSLYLNEWNSQTNTKRINRISKTSEECTIFNLEISNI